MKRVIYGLCVVLLTCSAVGCGGMYSKACGGRAVLKSMAWHVADHHLDYESAECHLQAEMEKARVTFRRPDTTKNYQHVYISLNQASRMDGIYEMIVLKNGAVVGRDVSDKPFMREGMGTFRTAMGVAVPKHIELPLEVVVVHANGKRVLRYVIEPTK